MTNLTILASDGFEGFLIHNKYIKNIVFLILGIIMGVFFEVAYWVGADFGTSFIEKYIEYYGVFFLACIFGVAAIGIVLLVMSNKKRVGFLQPFVIYVVVITAFITHHYMEYHIKEVYCYLHNEAFTFDIEWEYHYLPAILGLIYNIWIGMLIIDIIVKLKKRIKK